MDLTPILVTFGYFIFVIVLINLGEYFTNKEDKSELLKKYNYFLKYYDFLKDNISLLEKNEEKLIKQFLNEDFCNKVNEIERNTVEDFKEKYLW